MKRRIVAAYGDTHGAHRLGLLNPAVELLDQDEAGNPRVWTPTPTATQRWLWDWFGKDVASVMELAQGDDVVVIHTGDCTSGRKYPEGLISTRDLDQFAIAVANMAPWLEHDNVTTIRLVHGTQSHEFSQGTAPDLVAGQLGILHPARSIKATRHGLFVVDGVRFDCAHHGPTAGIRRWTAGNQLRLYTRSLIQDSRDRGIEPPDVVLRAHYHTYCREVIIWTHDQSRQTEAVITPAYCGLSHYTVQATRSAYLTSCGMVAFVIEDGRLVETHAFTRAVDLRTEEVL